LLIFDLILQSRSVTSKIQNPPLWLEQPVPARLGVQTFDFQKGLSPGDLCGQRGLLLEDSGVRHALLPPGGWKLCSMRGGALRAKRRAPRRIRQSRSCRGREQSFAQSGVRTVVSRAAARKMTRKILAIIRSSWQMVMIRQTDEFPTPCGIVPPYHLPTG
jgi:hypothetical protein